MLMMIMTMRIDGDDDDDGGDVVDDVDGDND